MSRKIVETDNTNADFINLTKLLDDDLNERYGALQKQYDRHNKIDCLLAAVLIYKDRIPAACGAYKEHGTDTVEIKRVFVKKEYRRQGLSRQIISQLENSAKSKGYRFAVLETGIKQHEAVSLYKSLGYTVIQNYEPYIGDENSICMKKDLFAF